ncbi:MAG: helix-turn-helix domain-containing protein [Saccharospirillum sp.]
MNADYPGLKALRTQRQWSLDQASKKTGVSKAMLGQIERGESSPTLNTLWKIARGFELSFSQLMAVLVPQAIGASFTPSESGLSVRTLVPYDAGMQAELLELTLSPGGCRESAAHEPGVTEHVIVLSGVMSVAVDGLWHPLTSGQVLAFAADRPHAYRNDQPQQEAVFHNLIYYPRGRSAVEQA